jgi:hypothetical protein
MGGCGFGDQDDGNTFRIQLDLWNVISGVVYIYTGEPLATDLVTGTHFTPPQALNCLNPL